MIIGSPKELQAGEKRVAMTPASASQLIKLGFECIIETGAGVEAGFSDADYKAAGVKIIKTAANLWKQSDIIIKVQAVNKVEEAYLNKDKTVISFFWPAQNKELLDRLVSSGCSQIAMDMVPRISRAQKWTLFLQWQI